LFTRPRGKVQTKQIFEENFDGVPKEATHVLSSKFNRHTLVEILIFYNAEGKK
jgi:hypothetical protein